MTIVDDLLFAVTLVAALGCGLMAGLFFAFSVSVMKALARLPSAQGIAAMQSINVAIIKPLFLAAFFGTAAACVLIIIASFFRWSTWSSAAHCIWSAPLGDIRVQRTKNNALASVAPDNTESAGLWSDYLSKWTAWNHVRTVPPLAAATSLTIALCYGA
jgi:uncharacterized membrane protein